jgi:HK97 family phage major capsid protein
MRPPFNGKESEVKGESSYVSVDREQLGEVLEQQTKQRAELASIKDRQSALVADLAELRSGNGNGDGYAIGAPQGVQPGWRNPSVLTGKALDRAEARRGWAMMGSDSDAVRRQGRDHMEAACPGAYKEYLEWRAEQERRANLPAMQKATFTSSADIVPVLLQDVIDHERAEPSYIGDLGQLVEMGSGSHKLPKESTAVSAANFAEDETISESSFAVGSTTLTSIKGAVIQHIGLETVQDASADCINHIFRRSIDSVNELETAQALEGDGSGNNFEGVLSATGVHEVDLANGGAALGDLDLLAEMCCSIPAADRDRERCAWFVSSDGYRAFLQIQDAAGAQPMLGQTPKELFGFPIIVTDQITTTSGTPDTSTVFFGNWRGLAIGRRGPDMLDVVSFGGTTTAFNKALVSLRVIRRYSVGVHIPTLLVRGINLRVAA